MFKNSINNCLYCFTIIPESEQMRRRKGRLGLTFKRKNLKLPVFIDYSESQSKVSPCFPGPSCPIWAARSPILVQCTFLE